MNDCIKGLAHIHSSYSFDSKCSLKELATLCGKKGYRFMLLSEHAEGYTQEKMQELVQECKDLSSEDLYIFPGLEYNCEGMHILALGVNSLIDESDLPGMIRRIHELGGISVLAHVIYYNSIPYERLSALDGVEVWNPRYEGNYSPSLRSLRILKKFRERNKRILACGGLDLHETGNMGRIWLCVEPSGNGREAIFSALKNGRFKITNGTMSFDALKSPSAAKFCIICAMRAIYKGRRLLEKFIGRLTNNPMRH